MHFPNILAIVPADSKLSSFVYKQYLEGLFRGNVKNLISSPIYSVPKSTKQGVNRIFVHLFTYTVSFRD